MAGAALDLVTHDDVQPTFPAVHPEGYVTLTYGELAEFIGEFERAPRHDGKTLVPTTPPRSARSASCSADQR